MINIIRKISFIVVIVFISIVAMANFSPSSAATRVGYDFSQSSTKYLTTPKILSTITYVPNTFEAWINIPTSVSGRAGIILGNYPDSNGFGFEIFDGYPRVYWNGGEFDWKLSETNATAGFQVHTSNWVYIAITRKFVTQTATNNEEYAADLTASSLFTCYVYKNGTWSTATKTGVSTNKGIGNFCIGRDKRTSTLLPFRGKIADVKLNRSCRTAAEIKANYDTPTLSPSVAWFKLDEGQSATHFKDSSTRQNNAALAVFKTATRGSTTVIDDWVNYTTPSYYGTSPNDFAMTFTGDPQSLSYLSYLNTGSEQTYYSLTNWIKANATAKKIKFSVCLGDTTWYNSKTSSNKGVNNEWDIARSAWGSLNGVVPYILNPGNHDYARHVSSKPWYYTYRDLNDMNAKFPASEYTKWDSWGGAYQEGDIANVYHKIIVGDYKYLIMGLEFHPRSEVLTWASEVVARHPEYRVIVTTHSYMGGTAYRSSSLGDGYMAGLIAGDTPYGENPGGNPGSLIWDNFIKKYSNIAMVVCGHVNAENIVYRVDKGINGNDVYQFVINPQFLDEKDITDFGGPGYGLLGLFMFSNEGRTIDVNYYSPSKGKSYRATNQFTFNVEYADAPATKSITMEDMPFKTDYKLGEDLNVAGAKIKLNSAIKDSSSIVHITKEMVSGYNPSTLGLQTITVNYAGKTTSFKVNVTRDQLSALRDANLGVLTYTKYMGDSPNGTQEIIADYASTYNLQLEDELGYEFLCLVENNHLMKNTLNYTGSEIPLNITSDSILQVIYKQESKKAVIFTDSNDKVLGVKYVASGASVTDLTGINTSELSKDANLFSGWNHNLENITSDIIVKAVYTKDLSNPVFNNNFVVTVLDGTTTTQVYKYGEVATLMPSVNANFKGWSINNKIVSRDKVYKFSVLKNTTVTAVYSTVQADDLPLINLDAISNANGKASFVGAYYLPSSFEIVETGIILQKSVVANNVDLSSKDIIKVKASSINNNNEFMITIKNEVENDVLQGRAYLTFKLSASSTIYTIYSDVAYHSFVEAYVVPEGGSSDLLIEKLPVKIFANVASAIAAGKKSICLLPGEYNSPMAITTNNVYLFGPNKGVAGNAPSRLPEAMIKAKISLTSQAKNLTIDGLAFSYAGQVYANNVNGLDGLTFINNCITDSKIARGNNKEAVIAIVSSDAVTANTTVVANVKPAFLKQVVSNYNISNNYFSSFSSSYITIYGINNINIENNVFDNGMEGIRLHFNQGLVNIKGNSFYKNGVNNYGLYCEGSGDGAFSLILQQSISGVVDIKYNSFDEVAGGASFLTPLRYYQGGATSTVIPSNLVLNINYNSFENKTTLSTNTSNYNKNFLLYAYNTSTVTCNIDYNYYDSLDYSINANGVESTVSSISKKYLLGSALDAAISTQALGEFDLENVFITGDLSISANEYSTQLSIVSNIPGYINESDYVKWHSTNTSIATIDQNGLLEAVGSGSVEIYAISKQNPNIYDSTTVSIANTTKALTVGFSGVAAGEIVKSNGVRYQVLQNYATITSAVSAAGAGSTVFVNSGTYTGAVTVSANNINIISSNANINPNTDSRNAEALISGVITLGSASTTVSGFKLNGFSLTNGGRVVSDGKVNGFTFINNYVHSTGLGSAIDSAIIKLGVSKSTTALIKSSGINKCTNVIVSNNKVVGSTTTASTNIAAFTTIYGLYGTKNFFENNNITGGGMGFCINYSCGDLYIQGNVFTKVGKAIANGAHPIYFARVAVQGDNNIIVRYNIFDACKGQGSLFPMIRNYAGADTNVVLPSNLNIDIQNNLFKNLTNTATDGYYLYYGVTKTRCLKFVDNFVDKTSYHLADGVVCNVRDIPLSNTSYFAANGKLKHKWYLTGDLAGSEAILQQSLVSYYLVDGSASTVKHMNRFSKQFYLQQQKNILDNNSRT